MLIKNNVLLRVGPEHFLPVPIDILVVLSAPSRGDLQSTSIPRSTQPFYGRDVRITPDGGVAWTPLVRDVQYQVFLDGIPFGDLGNPSVDHRGEVRGVVLAGACPVAGDGDDFLGEVVALDVAEDLVGVVEVDEPTHGVGVGFGNGRNVAVVMTSIYASDTEEL